MVGQARERFAAERRRLGRRRRGVRHGALPNLTGDRGLKCGTTSLTTTSACIPRSRCRGRRAQLLRRRAQLGPRSGLVRQQLRPGRWRAGRDVPTTPTCPASPGSPSGCTNCCPTPPESSTWSATRSTGCSRTTCTTSAGLRGEAARGGARGSRLRLRRPQPLRDAGQAVPAGVRRRAAADRLPRGARRRAPGDDAPRVRVLRRRPGLRLVAVRARVGDRQRQVERDSVLDRAVRLPEAARPRSQLRPPASRFAGWSSAWSTIRTPAPHRSRRSTHSSTTASPASSATK